MFSSYAKLNLREKITLSYSCIIIVVLLSTLATAFMIYYNNLKKSIDDNLINMALSVSHNPAKYPEHRCNHHL